MPGTTVVSGGDLVGVVDEGLDAVQFLDWYEERRHATGDGAVVATTGYEGYPTESFAVGDCTAVLEGHLYGVDAAETVREAVARIRDRDTDALSAWIGSQDGDFLLTVCEPDGTVTVVNDAFGRLPTYYAAVGGGVALSRELKFVREAGRLVGEPFSLDPVAVGQTLLLRYRLGTRTLFEGVRRLEPGSLLRIADGEVETERLHVHEFGGAAHADRSVEENAAALRDLFVEACAARASADEKSVVSLSGGLDSRAVLAGYDAAGADLAAATSWVEGSSNRSEIPTAREVAGVLDVDWSSYVLTPNDHHRAMLLDMRQGTNSLVMHPALAFCERLREEHGPATLVTGDGGDKVFPDLHPSKRVRSVDALVEYVVEEHEAFPLETAAAVAGVEPEVLLGTVRERIESYPESDLRQRYVHFLLRERGMNWLFQGEDRTRGYLWSTTPFYGRRFFEYAMNCPDEQKKGSTLYRAFLHELSEPVLAVEYADYGAPITSLEYKAKKFVYDALGRYPRVRSVVVSLFSGGGGGDSTREVEQLLADALMASEEVEGLRRGPLANLVANAEEYPTVLLYELYTLVSVASGESTPTAPDPSEPSATTDGATADD